MENSEIIDLAMMCMAVDQSPGDEAVAKRFTAALEPWQNGFAERLIGSIRRECVDHVIVLGEAHLRRILTKYTAYYNELRTHRSLNKDAPIYRAIQHMGCIISAPILGGLHHRYCRIKFSVHTRVSVSQVSREFDLTPYVVSSASLPGGCDNPRLPRRAA